MNNCGVDSLYNLALNKLCNSMNEHTLQCVLKSYPPLNVLEVIWKILRVNGDSEEFVFNQTHPNGSKYSVIRGNEIAKMGLLNTSMASPLEYLHLRDKAHEDFSKTQQTTFQDESNFCNYFDYILFLKLVKTGDRSKLFTIFQICVQKHGFTFPKEFADKWINSEIPDDNNNKIFRHIEHGLKLGIFLGDAGWLNESAIVLSFTFKLISTRWVCPDQNLKLLTMIQCLTKWLLVTSNYHNFDEAKDVLEHMLTTINILENIKERTLCISDAYVSISQYYYVLMEYNEAWSWVVKAVNELHDESDIILKLLVISHAIRVCSVSNKLRTAKKLIKQLHAYDKEVDQDIHIDMLMNEACYSLKANLPSDSIFSYYTALDSRRNLFGYYNLHTAIVFVDYAYTRYICDYTTADFNESMRCILQGIFIMKKIGLQDDNMLLANAVRIRALILEGKALNLIDRGQYYSSGDELKKMLEKMKKDMLIEAENLHLKALDVSLKAVGEKALLTAKPYCNLGRLYRSQEKYTESEKMHLKAIEIKESILGKDHPDVALCLNHLASLYTYQLTKYKEAEQLYLRSITIYETAYGHQHLGLLSNFLGLTKVYRALGNIDKHNQYTTNIQMFRGRRIEWLHQMRRPDDENCRQEDLSLEKFKCILNDCGCEKQLI